MDTALHYLGKFILLAIGLAFFYVVYTLALPDAGSSLGAIIFAAFGAFAATCLIVTIVQLLACAFHALWLKTLQPYIRRKLDKTEPYNWIETRT